MSPKSVTPAAERLSLSERTSQTDDQRIRDVTPLPPPEHLIRFFPIAGTPVETLVKSTRDSIRRVMNGDDDRLLVVVGPCSIHDPMAALEYARKLKVEREKHAGDLEIVMRVYFEKPRTTVGWKGLINDPYLDETYRIHEGLRIARQLLVDINRVGVPAASEFLDVISPQYIGDLIAWGAIGARTTESQVHRELASGLSAPVGFKNGTDGNIRIAIDAIQAAARPHHFLSVHKNGQVAIVETRGNKEICERIVERWSRPIFERKSDYSRMPAPATYEALPASGERPPTSLNPGHVGGYYVPQDNNDAAELELHPLTGRVRRPRVSVPKPLKLDFSMQPASHLDAKATSHPTERKKEVLSRLNSLKNKTDSFKRIQSVAVSRLEL